jgi:hypothetical protein
VPALVPILQQIDNPSTKDDPALPTADNFCSRAPDGASKLTPLVLLLSLVIPALAST